MIQTPSLFKLPTAQIFLLCSTIGSLLISIWCLFSGYFIIFQNLLYIPIILACILYLRKGLYFSCLLAGIYIILIAVFTSDTTILLQAGIRAVIFIGVAIVITYLASLLKQTENSLKTANQVQESVISNARVWLMALDTRGHVVVWNKAAEEMSGYSADEVKGSGEIWKHLYPDSEYRKTVTSTIKKIISEDTYLEDFETEIRTKQGDIKNISWNTKIVPDGENSIITYIAIGIDITDKKKISVKIGQQSKFLQILMDTLPNPIFYKDAQGVYTGCNTAFEKYFGKPRDQIIGKSVYDLWPEEMAEVYYQADQDIVKSPVPQQYEASVQYPDGSVHAVVFYKAPIFDNSNHPNGLIGTFLDITERKKSEDALRESESQYHSLFNNMLEGFAYCRMIYDPDGKPSDWMYIDVNKAFETHTGLSDVKGRLASDIFPGIREQSPDLFDLYNGVVVTGTPVSFETFFQHLQIWLRISVYKPREGDFVAIFENITDRKNAEMNVQKIIRELELILQNVPVMISFKDIDNHYVKVNNAVARMMGRAIQEIDGKTYTDLFPGLPDPFAIDDDDVMRSNTPKLGVIQRLADPQANKCWVQTDTVPLAGEDGQVFGILIVSTDITETKRAKDTLSLTNHKLNLLSGITRHDIGNELQILFGCVGLLQDLDMNDEVREYIEKIATSSKHIQRQIAFTRDYQDIGVHAPTWLDVKTIISQAMASIDSARIQIILEISGVEIYADPLIGKVFYNLMDNAIRYGEKISTLRFSRLEKQGVLLIICDDDGVGIPDEFKQKIFNREYYKHTGFGLNLSREILDITGISISENGTYGKGARFEITVPQGGYRMK